MQSCKSCKYWHSGGTGRIGYCTRYAPKGGRKGSSHSGWPETWDSMGCGEYTPDVAYMTDKIEGLEADLASAVEKIWQFDEAGKVWCRMNYPKLVEKFEARDKTA